MNAVVKKSPYAVQPAIARKGVLGRAADTLGLIACVVVMGVLCVGMLAAMSRVGVQ